MIKPLADRIALVTGASRGIGAATAKVLAREGAHVIALARTVGGLEELDDSIRTAGGTATLVPADLTDFAALDRLGVWPPVSPGVALGLPNRYATRHSAAGVY